MKKLQLFEVGFKEQLHLSSYDDKFYITAETAEDAIERSRSWFVESHDNWEEKELRNVAIARVQHIGYVVI